MHDLGIKIECQMGRMTWDSTIRPMRSVNTDECDPQLIQEEHLHSETLKKALPRQEEALDVASTPVEMKKVL